MITWGLVSPIVLECHNNAMMVIMGKEVQILKTVDHAIRIIAQHANTLRAVIMSLESALPRLTRMAYGLHTTTKPVIIFHLALRNALKVGQKTGCDNLKYHTNSPFYWIIAAKSNGKRLCANDFPLDYGSTNNKLYNFDVNWVGVVKSALFPNVKTGFNAMQPNQYFAAGQNYVVQYTGRYFPGD